MNVQCEFCGNRYSATMISDSKGLSCRIPPRWLLVERTSGPAFTNFALACKANCARALARRFYAIAWGA